MDLGRACREARDAPLLVSPLRATDVDCSRHRELDVDVSRNGTPVSLRTRRPQTLDLDIRAIILQCGAFAILGLGWFDLWARLLIGPPRARILPTLVPLAGTLPWIVFPAALLLAIAWFRHNARRWCVTL